LKPIATITKLILPKRCAGVLLHVSSLPGNSDMGICSTGDFGSQAYRFIDFLTEIGASIWQTLPLNMPHDGGSPYQCLSAHAGNPAFVCMDILLEQQLLHASDIADLQNNRPALFGRAYLHYKQLNKLQDEHVLQHEFGEFCRDNISWLGDFALFLVLKEKFQQTCWSDWAKPYKDRYKVALDKIKQEYAFEITVIKFTQFLFFRQWIALKTYANQHGIAMFGDIPIFVAYDSADVWAKPHLFKLDANKKMQVVAGVPPDYFSVLGQRWGNPHYNWQAMRANGFRWWLARIRTQQHMFDMLRIDHFRGLESAWEVPAKAPNAINGEWVKAPGKALLKAITKQFPDMQLIAEDLGVITEQVNALRECFKLPSMKILQFAFGSGESNPYLPHNIEQNSVAYTGTHDNDTTLGWYLQLDDGAKKHLHQALGGDVNLNSLEMPAALVDMVMASNANMAIVPMQDILALDSSHRMNIPGTIEKNWLWRFKWNMLTVEQLDTIKQAIARHNRAAHHH
jgi:4-alpha-glucanotransferase